MATKKSTSAKRSAAGRKAAMARWHGKKETDRRKKIDKKFKGRRNVWKQQQLEQARKEGKTRKSAVIKNGKLKIVDIPY